MPHHRIEGVPLSESWRVWAEPQIIVRVDDLGSRARTNIKSFVEFWTEQKLLLFKIWQRCRLGELEVAAYEQASGPESNRIFPLGIVRAMIAVPEANTAYLDGKTLLDIKIFGRVPSWMPDGPLFEGCGAPEFQHNDDYTIVQIRGECFPLGLIQSRIVRILHEAALSGEPWVGEKDLIFCAGGGARTNINDLFRRNTSWRELIARVQAGRYTLNLKTPLHRFPCSVLPENREKSAPFRVKESNFTIPKCRF